MKKTINIFLSICFSLFIIGLVCRFTVEFKELYYFDIDYLNIEAKSNMTKDEIILNYDYLVDYNLSKEEVEFHMPTLKYSEEGKIHFEEVRDIVQNINKILYVCFFLSIVYFFINIKDRSLTFLKNTSKMIIAIPIVLSIPIIIDFDRSFVVFHEILFDNDYWIFDPNLDPVINMLPQEFFFHAGVMILVLLLISSVILYVGQNILNKKLYK